MQAGLIRRLSQEGPAGRSEGSIHPGDSMIPPQQLSPTRSKALRGREIPEVSGASTRPDGPRPFHRQSCMPGREAQCCSSSNYTVRAKVHVWPRNHGFVQSRLSEDVTCLRQPGQDDGGKLTWAEKSLGALPVPPPACLLTEPPHPHAPISPLQGARAHTSLSFPQNSDCKARPSF